MSNIEVYWTSCQSWDRNKEWRKNTDTQINNRDAMWLSTEQDFLSFYVSFYYIRIQMSVSKFNETQTQIWEKLLVLTVKQKSDYSTLEKGTAPLTVMMFFPYITHHIVTQSTQQTPFIIISETW